MPDGRISVQGTATNFSPLDGVEIVELNELEELADAPGVVPGVAAEAPAVPLVPGAPRVVLPSLPVELQAITAKSILPEAGLIITSSSLPNCSPEEPLTVAPMSLLARTSCCPERPVALNPWLELLAL